MSGRGVGDGDVDNPWLDILWQVLDELVRNFE